MPTTNILIYACIGLSFLLVGAGLTIWSQSARIDRLTLENALQTANIGTLEYALEVQNGRVAEMAALHQEALRASQEAVQAAEERRVLVAQRVQDLLSRPVPSDPIQACTVANELILEYYQ